MYEEAPRSIMNLKGENMNFKYKCIILTIAICIMLSFTAVSASDNHTDTNQGLAPDGEIGIGDDSNEK